MTIFFSYRKCFNTNNNSKCLSKYIHEELEHACCKKNKFMHKNAYYFLGMMDVLTELSAFTFIEGGISPG